MYLQKIEVDLCQMSAVSVKEHTVKVLLFMATNVFFFFCGLWKPQNSIPNEKKIFHWFTFFHWFTYFRIQNHKLKNPGTYIFSQIQENSSQITNKNGNTLSEVFSLNSSNVFWACGTDNHTLSCWCHFRISINLSTDRKFLQKELLPLIVYKNLALKVF